MLKILWFYCNILKNNTLFCIVFCVSGVEKLNNFYGATMNSTVASSIHSFTMEIFVDTLWIK